MDELDVTSEFENNSFIPKRYSCDGENINPPLDILDLPDNVQSLALILDDPDASMGTFVHWVAWNIKPGNISENSGRKFKQGLNSTGEIGYIGPCPPLGGEIHHYHFKIYALDCFLDIEGEEIEKDDLIREIEGKVVAFGEIVGLYERK